LLLCYSYISVSGEGSSPVSSRKTKKGDYTRKISTLLESNPELLLVPQSPFRLEKLTENSPENFALAWRIFGEKLKNQSKMMIF